MSPIYRPVATMDSSVAWPSASTTDSTTFRSSEDHEPFLRKESGSHGGDLRRQGYLRSPLWFCLAVLLLFALAVQNIYLFALRGATLGSFEDGYFTELDYLKSFIHLQPTRFRSAILPTEDLTDMHVPTPFLDEQGRRYTGPPSVEVDAAWSDLIYGRYVNFTSSELAWLNSDTQVPNIEYLAANSPWIPTGGFFGGPDMLHSLHCLNGIRNHLNANEYGLTNSPEDEGDLLSQTKYRRMHLDHCLEQLRQAVLCHGDLTPVTLRPVEIMHGGENVKILLGETEREHMCRDGLALAKAWREEGERRGRVKSM